MKAPAVSVCIPAHDAEDFLEATLRSVWCQTEQNFEVIVVDDASTDSTPEVLAAQQDSRLRTTRNPRNRKAAGAYNRCLELSRGEYVKFLDSDDLLLPTCIERLLSVLDGNPDMSMAFGRRRLLLEMGDDPQIRAWAQRFREPHRTLGDLPAVSDGRELLRRWAASGLGHNPVGEPATVMARRRQALDAGGFDLNLSTAYDQSLWGKLMARGTVGFVDEDVAHYRVHTNSLTWTNAATFGSWLDHAWKINVLRRDPAVDMPAIETLHPRARRRAIRAFLALLGEQGAGARLRQLTKYLSCSI